MRSRPDWKNCVYGIQIYTKSCGQKHSSDFKWYISVEFRFRFAFSLLQLKQHSLVYFQFSSNTVHSREQPAFLIHFEAELCSLVYSLLYRCMKLRLFSLVQWCTEQAFSLKSVYSVPT